MKCNTNEADQIILQADICYTEIVGRIIWSKIMLVLSPDLKMKE